MLPARNLRVIIVATECAVQILALFKGYDLAWPRATSSAMSWSDTANLGITVTAPSCYWARYGYYQSWIITMALPVGCRSSP